MSYPSAWVNLPDRLTCGWQSVWVGPLQIRLSSTYLWTGQQWTNVGMLSSIRQRTDKRRCHSEARYLVSEMTCCVSSGTWNHTHSSLKWGTSTTWSSCSAERRRLRRMDADIGGTFWRGEVGWCCLVQTLSRPVAARGMGLGAPPQKKMSLSPHLSWNIMVKKQEVNCAKSSNFDRFCSRNL